ncbi:putative helicase [Catenulispora sp. GAS73]|uniref:type ISP restriction/modification enzyme n=1 Tax=Catenulispora sp. GAS73 TaxID=3156269 RepID=UPI00351735F8
MFGTYSAGLKSGRDAWVYNFSEQNLKGNIARAMGFFNEQSTAFKASCEAAGITPNEKDVAKFINLDPTKFSWNRVDRARIRRFESLSLSDDRYFTGSYRPFMKQHVYFSADFNDMVYQIGRIFPEPEMANIGFYVVGMGSDKPFSVHATNALPDLAYWGSSNGQFYPRYRYDESQHDLFSAASDAPGYTRIDNITDATLRSYQKAFGTSVTKDDIFYYVYAVLHSPTYREDFAADLKKSLPRIPRVRDFAGFAVAGRALADLHLNYESVELYPVTETVTGTASSAKDLYRVEKMRYPSKEDKSKIRYNAHVVLSDIPAEAYDYQLGGRSAIEWIIDRYQVKTHKDSGIVNDPNDWSNDPRYIVDLLARIVTVSVETMRIVGALPDLDVIDEHGSAAG